MLKKILIYIIAIITYLLFLFSLLVIPLTIWFNDNFGISFMEIIYTVTASLKGANIDAFILPIVFAVCTVATSFIIYCLIIRWIKKYYNAIDIHLVLSFLDKKIKVNIKKIASIMIFLVIVIVAIYSCYFVDDSLSVRYYFNTKGSLTRIYEDYYINPSDVEISLGAKLSKPKNLIYIYLESMETSYASTEVGGFQEDVNYIPNLTKLAFENVSFSNDTQLGGFHSTNGTGWTIAAIFASSTGAAFAFPAGFENSMNERNSFAPGIITLGDILQEQGYYQEFLCGSDADFAGRAKFFEHGDFVIYDYYSAISDGYAKESEREFWGIDDSVLYQIAKDQLIELSQNDQPFNLTMLTLDTHFPEGYICELCDDAYDEQYANVIACADAQIVDFVEWCSEQDFYEDTVIIITGDHPFMGTTLVENVSDSDRTVYNCFINPYYNGEFRDTNRVFTTMDLFPTTIAALGFNIEGNRLGLGTNLFSDIDTLAEKMGLDYLNEAAGTSEYYLTNFN